MRSSSTILLCKMVVLYLMPNGTSKESFTITLDQLSKNRIKITLLISLEDNLYCSSVLQNKMPIFYMDKYMTTISFQIAKRIVQDLIDFKVNSYSDEKVVYYLLQKDHSFYQK
jgi:hypothetical protein